MPEWSNGAVSKTVVPTNRDRGFESLSLRINKNNKIMSEIRPFRAYRPKKENVKQTASRPYDVLNTQEARIESKGNDMSFYHVIKPEMDFPDVHDHYAPEIYKSGKQAFDKLLAKGVVKRDDKPCMYLYKLVMDGHTQKGLVACCSIDDYFNNVIKKHELTRPDKEEDRKNHVRYSKINYEPVFFAYPHLQAVDHLVDYATSSIPEYDFTSDDGIQHTLWVIDDDAVITKLVHLFRKEVPAIYVADGHHRTAAGALVGKEMRDADLHPSGNKGYNYFMAVLFPDNQLQIIDYNRVVKDLNGLAFEEFIDRIKNDFEITPCNERYKPKTLHTIGMYLEEKWYELKAKAHTYDDNDPVKSLDVTVLSDFILSPLFDIKNLRTDNRIGFIGGIRGLGELERLVDKGEWKIAFSMYPVSMQQLMSIADNDMIMPPKTTWFEPKLRSGLFVYGMDDTHHEF